MSDAVTEWAFATGWRLVKRLPARVAFGAFDQAADVLWRRRGAGVLQFERNQARIHPDFSPDQLRELSRRGMRSYLRYWCEAFRLPTMSPDEVNRTFDLERKELMDVCVASGTGAVMVVNHAGNWDLAGAWGCLRYGGLTTVAERLKPEGLFEQFVEYRESVGMNIVPLGDPDAIRRLARALKEGQIVPLLGDRDISRNGVIVDFFGEPASLPAGPAVLGMLTGAPVMPVTLWYEGRRATGYVHDAIPVPTEGTKAEKIQVMTQQVARAFEDGLRDHSVDWHMMQPVWIADLDPSRRRT
ncbi:MAG: phosphatidylinositol mannoside acyltransferase [Actinobacteria bacterium]|jgi:KDO2-lipid IV(A) lauroyltransferase|nr:phosphatidylinositol mannoside acyltransferase [Actinomycetota bacterium]